MFIDILLASLFEADHNNDFVTKEEIMYQLNNLGIDNSLYQSFLFLDTFTQKYDGIKQALENISTEFIEKGCYSKTRNSIYLFENGKITPQLPSHYKFDRTIAKCLNRSDSINKNNLFVPIESNTIRIYLNIAVLVYKPNINQIRALEYLGINNFVVNNYSTKNIFDEKIESLPTFNWR